METPLTPLRARTFARSFRIACVASLVGSALTVSSPARADGPAPAAPATPPGQKPPCVPAASYTLGYDCELFPLPSLPAPAGGAAPVAVVAVIPVVVPPTAAAPGVVVPAVSPDTAAPDTGAAVVVPVVAPETPSPAVPPAATDASSGSPSHAPAYVAFAVGLGGVGMTAAFGILALQANSTLSKDCTNGNCPAKDSSTLSNMKLYDNLADVGLGVAAAGVITGVILFVTEKPSSTTTGARHFEPWIGLGSGGVRGSF